MSWPNDTTKQARATDATATEKSLMACALRCLARRDYSTAELLARLQQKSDDATLLQNVVNKLKSLGYLNDCTYAEKWVRARRAKGYGPIRIAADLSARGIPSEIAANALLLAEDDWLHDLENQWHRKRQQLSCNQPREQAKIVRFLHYRGYTHAQIRSFLREKTNIIEMNEE